ncbi:serine hydrolase domain-containing protein [Prescottella subtropica]|uniref:serine hydrolase domain-containing protein n=1 Tax=Prescottella subtropica TaxID=2545757 RepID=UPI0010F877E5|nr:serine hydrolase domain-containing protein [Prescottella subtropica]
MPTTLRRSALAVATFLTLSAVGAAPAAADVAPTPNPGSVPGDAAESAAVVATAQQILAHSGPGLAIAVTKPDPAYPGASLTTSYYFGDADKALGRRVGPQTQFEIASETKTFTAALLAKRIAQGQAHLDDPAQPYASGVTLPSRDGAVITLGDLVTHRSGLTDDPPNLDAPCGGVPGCNPKPRYDRGYLWQGLEKPDALFAAPGTQWLYSDFGFGTLGTLLADTFAPGHPEPAFGQVVADELTGPLGMTSTTLETRTPDLAQPYAHGKPANLWDNTAALAGGGGLISTASDMAIWAAATLGYGDNPLVPVLQSMLTEIPGPTDPKNPGTAMGMAWQLFPASGSTPAYAFKNGGAAGSTSATVLVPENGWAITVLNNGANMDFVSSATTTLMQTLVAGEPGPGATGSVVFGSTGS